MGSTATDFCSLSWKLRWIAITPKPFSALSIISCIFVIKHILSRKKRGSASVYHHLVLALTAFFLFGSIAAFIGTWAIPEDSPGVCLAAGNDISCTIQGFCIQMFGLGSSLYYSSLSIYYYLTINRGWNEKELKKAEQFLLATPFIFSLSTAIAGATLDMYHNAHLWCFIAEPANNVDAYRMALFYGPSWASLLLATVLMVLIFRHVLQKERATDRYSVTTPDGIRAHKNRKNTKMVAKQAIAYVVSFYLVLMFPSIVRISEMAKDSADFGLVALFTIVQPSQGIFNLLVYFRPRYLRYRRNHPDLHFCQILKICVQSVLPVTWDSTTTRTSFTSHDGDIQNNTVNVLQKEEDGAERENEYYYDEASLRYSE